MLNLVQHLGGTVPLWSWIKFRMTRWGLWRF